MASNDARLPASSGRDALVIVDLFEQSAANGTPIREVVGEDPVEFAAASLRNYPEGQWISRERERLISAIDRVAGEDPGKERRSV